MLVRRPCVELFPVGLVGSLSKQPLCQAAACAVGLMSHKKIVALWLRESITVVRPPVVLQSVSIASIKGEMAMACVPKCHCSQQPEPRGPEQLPRFALRIG